MRKRGGNGFLQVLPIRPLLCPSGGTEESGKGAEARKHGGSNHGACACDTALGLVNDEDDDGSTANAAAPAGDEDVVRSGRGLCCRVDLSRVPTLLKKREDRRDDEREEEQNRE